jgi:hypothetical protein
MIKLAFHITLFGLLLLSSCVTMPHEHLTVIQRGDSILPYILNADKIDIICIRGVVTDENA